MSRKITPTQVKQSSNANRITATKSDKDLPIEELKKLNIEEDAKDLKLIYMTDSSNDEDIDDKEELNDVKKVKNKKKKRPMNCGDFNDSDGSEINLDILNDELGISSKASDSTGSNKTDKNNVSFSSQRLKEIKKENEMLVKKLLSQTKVTKPKSESNLNQISSTAAINRKKAQWNIDRTNQILFKKIQAAKASGFSIRKKAPICRETKMCV